MLLVAALSTGAAGCQSAEAGFAEAQDYDNLQAWREFVDRHGEDREHPKVQEGRQILADRLLQVCVEEGGGAAPPQCAAPIWKELPETRSGDLAATVDGRRQIAVCKAAAGTVACLERAARTFERFQIGREAAEQAATAQISQCSRRDPTAECFLSVAAAWKDTEAGAGAGTVAKLFTGSGSEQLAWLRDNATANAAWILRGKLCMDRKLLVFDDAKREKLARDGVQALVRIREAAAEAEAEAEAGNAGKAAAIKSVVAHLKDAGCEVEHWTEPDVTVNIASGAKAVSAGDEDGDGEADGTLRYRPSHRLKKKHRAKYDVVVWARRAAIEELKYGFGEALKIAFKRTTEVARKGDKRGKVIRHKWTYMESQGLPDPVQNKLAEKAAAALAEQERQHLSSVLAELDAALAAIPRAAPPTPPAPADPAAPAAPADLERPGG